ncbi:hypothetical protein KBD33_05225, partial [Candidatus Gracilibacteria bacterium]|nr:hypothetical protein [Candidatus Gracilibacteria bacterium]
MKKTLSSLLLTSLIFGNVFPVYTTSVGAASSSSQETQEKPINYPSGSEFEKIKSIIDTYLTKKEDRYYGIQWKTKPNYTPVIEKELKFLILSTYEGHADFYKKLFSYDGRYHVLAEDKESVKNILQRVPRAQHMDISSMLGGNSSMSDTFIDASFGVDFSEQDGSSDLKSAVENKLKEVMTDKCVETTRHTDCYRNKLSNKYLPTPEEFGKKTIYLKRESVKIGDIQDQIEYKVYGTIQKSSKQRPSPSDFEKLFIEYNVDINTQQKDIFVANPNETTLQPIIDSINTNREIGTSEKFVLKRGVNQFMDDSKQEVFYPEDATYTLEYKSKSYTHEDALKEVESKQNKVEKKDYKKLMDGAKVENIPEIFKKIPNDSVSLYIKNPQNLLSILDQPSSGLQL